MGVEDNYYQIPDLDATDTFYDWVVKENTEIIPKLNLMSIYGISGGTGINVIIGTTGNSYDSGLAIISLNEVLSNLEISGDLVLGGGLQLSDGTNATSIVTSVNGQTGAVVISTGPTGSSGITGATGETIIVQPTTISDNHLINGNFDVWQRGTIFSGKPNKHFADRWSRFATPTSLTKITTDVIKRSEFSLGQTEVLGNPLYYTTYTLTHTGLTATDFIGIENKVEGGDKFIGESLYVDGYLRVSGVSGATLDVYIRRNPDGSGYSVEEFENSVYVDESWSSFLVGHGVTYTGSTFTNEGYVSVGIKINNLPSGTTLDISNIRAFSIQGGTLSESPYRKESDPKEELQKCSRFYQRSYDLDENTSSITMLGISGPSFSPVRFTVTPSYRHYYNFPVEMRKSPTVSVFSPESGVTSDAYNYSSGLDMRLSSGTSGYNGEIRLHSAGQSTIVPTATTKGIIFDTVSGRVVFDDIFVNYVADSDYPL